MMREIGYCQGIENYSRYFDGRKPGDAPYSLLDYFPKDFHVASLTRATSPSRRYAPCTTATAPGRIPWWSTASACPPPMTTGRCFSASSEQRIHQTVYVSATPGRLRASAKAEQVVEQIIRPTGLLDPQDHACGKATGQVDDLVGEIRQVTARNEAAACWSLRSPSAWPRA